MKHVISIIALLLVSGTPTWALMITPGRTEVRLVPGEKIKGTLTATNDTSERISLALSTKDWFILGSNHQKNLLIDTWLKVHGKKSFKLKPGESRDVKFTATCPQESEGELVGMVSFTDVSHPESMMTPMISVSIYVEASGTEKRSGEIEELALRKWNDQIQAAVAVKSTGNVHLRPVGTMTLAKETGEAVALWDVKEGGPAYPGSSQGYFAAVPPDFKLVQGRYKIRADLEYRGLVLKAERGLAVSPDGTIKMDSKTK